MELGWISLLSLAALSLCTCRADPNSRRDPAGNVGSSTATNTDAVWFSFRAPPTEAQGRSDATRRTQAFVVYA
ncbi:MAG TPA: hypothetical protein VFQ35_01020, partial [Polyangiaceae bacterium]|nr:hypothetical protein [Polyangiaceae bacterium]